MNKKYYDYADSVLNGSIVSCKKLRQAVDRFKSDINAGESFDYYFDEREADRVIRFCEDNLYLYQGAHAGELMTLDGWQAFKFANLFGWKDKKTGYRRFRKTFIYVAKGNGKSPDAAAMGLSFLLRDKGAEIYVLATSFDQACITYNSAKQFVTQSEKLSSMIEVHDSYLLAPGLSVMRPMSKSSKSFDGRAPSCLIVDEIAAMADSKIISPIESAMFKRPDSLEIMITTTNYISTTSPGYLEYQYASQVLDGVIKNDRYFPLIFELDKDDDWKTFDLRKANPSSFINLQALEEERQLALTRPEKQKEFRTKNCNEWVIGSNNQFIKNDNWIKIKNQAEEFADYLTPEKLLTYPAVMGCDFSRSRDLTCFTIAFYIAELDKIYLQHRAYIPRDSVEARAQNENELFLYWLENGYIDVSLGEMIDEQQITDDINMALDTYKIKSVAYDPNLSHTILDPIAARAQIVPYDQRRQMEQPSKDFDRLVVSKKIISNHPVMDWCISNARVYSSDSYYRVEKDFKDSPKKIDLVISSIMACHRLSEIAKVSTKPKVEIDYDALSKLIYG